MVDGEAAEEDVAGRVLIAVPRPVTMAALSQTVEVRDVNLAASGKFRSFPHILHDGKLFLAVSAKRNTLRW